MTNHCGKCNRDENKGHIAQINIECSSKSCWYNCERESPSVALVDRKVNRQVICNFTAEPIEDLKIIIVKLR